MLVGTQKMWQCPITTTIGSPGEANQSTTCCKHPSRSAHPDIKFTDFLKLFMADLLVQV